MEINEKNEKIPLPMEKETKVHEMLSRTVKAFTEVTASQNDIDVENFAEHRIQNNRKSLCQAMMEKIDQSNHNKSDLIKDINQDMVSLAAREKQGGRTLLFRILRFYRL